MQLVIRPLRVHVSTAYPTRHSSVGWLTVGMWLVAASDLWAVAGPATSPRHDRCIDLSRLEARSARQAALRRLLPVAFGSGRNLRAYREASVALSTGDSVIVVASDIEGFLTRRWSLSRFGIACGTVDPKTLDVDSSILKLLSTGTVHGMC